jgi:hypothetical protein
MAESQKTQGLRAKIAEAEAELASAQVEDARADLNAAADKLQKLTLKQKSAAHTAAEVVAENTSRRAKASAWLKKHW